MHASAPTPSRTRLLATFVTIGAVAAAVVALWLFPRAMPIVALNQYLSRDAASTRADSFFSAHALSLSGARTAVRFEGNDSLGTFVELAGGGHDSLNALVRGQDVALYEWSVRAFTPGNPREARVHFSPDGRVIGFSRTLAESDPRPDVGADSGRALAERTLTDWLGERLDHWRFVSASYETRKTSGRVDRRYTFERVDRTVAGAPIRVDVRIDGDLPAGVRRYVEIPETFRRRYGEMRSANDLLALLASLGALVIAIAGIVFLSRTARSHGIRWRPALIVGAIIGVLALGASLNDMPGSWYDYDTATSPTTFQAMSVLGAMGIGVMTMLLVGFTLAAAEAATRMAFPKHLDWWKLWRYRATRDVALRVGGGYAAACVAFAYVAVFYLVTRNLLGWWVPSELLDDPNQLASPMPWISGIAASLQAGVWEEALFRALPLSLISLWVGQRSRRSWWMAGGVVLTALVFGFAHSNYASWPPYSRGVEIFLDACFWAVLFLNFGVIVTMVAHFVYDLVLFGLFAATGNATEYRISAVIIALALLAPALAVIVARVRRGAFVAAPDDARFGAVVHAHVDDAVAATESARDVILTARARQFVWIALVAAIVVAVARAPQQTLGPLYTANRQHVESTADSMLRAHGGDPTGWRRLATFSPSDQPLWPRFVQEFKLYPQAQELAATFVPPTWWIVRYVHSDGASVQQRTEEWRVRVWPDGRPLDIRHVIADSVERKTVEPTDVRRIAHDRMEQEGIKTATLSEVEYKETARPRRKDVTVTFSDTAVHLPAGAAARAYVQVAGDEPLVARRTIELPETFVRADRERQTNRTLMTGVLGLLLLGAFIAGAIVVTRRRPALLDDGRLDRRAAVGFVVALTLFALLDRLNGLPSSLASYDTAEPWSRFMTTTYAGFAGEVVISLFVFGVWLTLGSLRRRVGVPMLPHGSGASVRRDLLAAGIGLGAVVFAMARLDALLELNRTPHLPRVPSTVLDQYVPWLAGVAGLPSSVILSASLAAIPILVIAGLTRRWPLRIAMAVVALGLLAGIVATMSSSTDIDPVGIALTLLKLIGVAGAIYAWGNVSAWSWLVAALVNQALDALRVIAYGATAPEQVAGALTFTVALVIIALVARLAAPTASHPQSAAASPA